MIKYDEIWLQDFGYGETTWCQDQINNDDERYIRATIADQHIAALEAELAAAQAAHAKSHEEAADWRRMVAQLEALFERELSADVVKTHLNGKGNFVVMFYGIDPDSGAIAQKGKGDTLPAAVAAAYEQVGVGETKIVKLIKLTERGKWHINERGFPVCGASLELDPIDEMEIERRILHEHAHVCAVCKREFKGVGDE